MAKGRKPGITYTKWSSNNKDYIIKRFRKKYLVDINTGCWIWLGKPNQGYGTFYMKEKIYPAHRASYILFIKDVPDDLLVCHTCNNTLCVNPCHLYVGTHNDNMRDLRKAKTLAGENNPNYGIKCSDEKKEKISSGVKKWINDNPNFDLSEYTSRHWKVIKPNGKLLLIKNLSKFCKENNLKLSKNKHGFYIVTSGWSIERI